MQLKPGDKKATPLAGRSLKNPKGSQKALLAKAFPDILLSSRK
jgi:hypothetical protein